MASCKLLGKFLHIHTQWDFITAIEVLEHIPNPLEILRRMRSLLKPGGKVFFTTGNAKPWRGKLDAWAYTSVPDVHISFFEPKTLALALKKTEFNAEFPGYISGFSNIIKYKILKTLKIKYRSKCIDLLPWNSIAKIVNYKYKVSSMPIGIAV